MTKHHLNFNILFDCIGLLPKSAMTAEEEAWNAYPYTKTRFTCPFVEKFSLEIETYYFPDDGHQENVFKLDGSDLRNRIVGKSRYSANKNNAQFLSGPKNYRSCICHKNEMLILK